MQDYYDALRKVLANGQESDDRTGTGTLSSFGYQMRFDLREGFPLLTGKFTPFKLIAAELLWFLSGSTNNEDLRRLNGNDKPTIWEEWAYKLGELGPIYGQQWRCWKTWQHSSDEFGFSIDQIDTLIKGLKNKPHSRRHIVSAWNVADLPDESISPQENAARGKMSLAPCHAFFQLNTRKLKEVDRAIIMGDTFIENWQAHVNWAHESSLAEIDALYIEQMDEANIPKYALSCQMYQRSADLFLGVPFNIASYALLTHMIAHVVNMVPEYFIHTLGNYHIYNNHIDQAAELLSRESTRPALPTLKINRKACWINDFNLSDFDIIGYEPMPAIHAPVSV